MEWYTLWLLILFFLYIFCASVNSWALLSYLGRELSEFALKKAVCLVTLDQTDLYPFLVHYWDTAQFSKYSIWFPVNYEVLFFGGACFFPCLP